MESNLAPISSLVIGASAGLGRALAEALAFRGHQLLLVASDPRDLDPLASDLRIRFGCRVETVATRIAPDQNWLGQITEAARQLGSIDGLYFPIGVADDNDRGMLDERTTRELLEANLMATILLTSTYLPEMMKRAADGNLARGVIVGFGSVAAIRGRSSNIVYSAAKRGLQSYFQSIRHLTSSTPIRVQLYQLGYLDTQQTFGRRLLFPKADPRRLAEFVADNLHRDIGARHYPRFWALIAIALRLLPWRLFRRLSL